MSEPYGEGWMWLQVQSGSAPRAVEAYVRQVTKELHVLREQVRGLPRRLAVTDEELDVIEEMRAALAERTP